MRGRLLGLGAALVLLSAAHVAGERAGAAKNAAADPDELLYLPEGRILRSLSLGHRNLLADVVWLQAIQYYGEQRLTTRNYEQAERLFRVIHDLDPTFKGATRFGALVLAQDAGDPQAALGLLARAERFDPTAWEYAFDRGFILQTVLKDYEAAGAAYREASRRPGAPVVAGRLAGLTFARLGDRAASRDVWLALWEDAENDMMRSVAERNLRNLDMEDAEDRLEAATRRFLAERDQLPAQWGELEAEGFVAQLPVEPWGGIFLIDPETLDVWATTRLDRRMAQERDVFQGYVRLAQHADGRWPSSLDALVERGIAAGPASRLLGLGLDYDPATGTVSWNPPWPATESRNQGGSPV